MKKLLVSLMVVMLIATVFAGCASAPAAAEPTEARQWKNPLRKPR
jgi:uncharacterized protein YceK